MASVLDAGSARKLVNVKQRRMFLWELRPRSEPAFVGNAPARRGHRSYKVSFFGVMPCAHTS